MGRVFFCNSGTEAVEASFKFARISTGRKNIIAAMRAFHGRTFGSLSATFNKKYREGFEPLLPGVSHVSYNNIEALAIFFVECSREQGPMGNVPSGQVRRWLEGHQFPVGFVATPTSGGLSATLDALKHDGWTTMKSGIGRTRGFADMLLQHRMEVVVVPELPKGELPRKAKAAKDWKEVRKKL